jgi:uncharacterized protein (DUF2235 family)
MTHPIKQRLAIFLDGTWNTEDDSTNVLHAYHSMIEGIVQEKDEYGNTVEIVQKRYYDRGVGTSVSDNVRGGGYGMGLETNVREAYNWLVDNYNDNVEEDQGRAYCKKSDEIDYKAKKRLEAKADEIYIFGFSRGAYTARSLVGLISSCGLVKRGAPVTVTQLWDGYAHISANRDQSYNWEEQLKKEEHKYHFGRLSSYKYRKPECSLYNDTERLINVWSRRVKITYLGIYDSVGAMGVHALGIPGLKSKLDAGHNTSPTSIIVKCRHALAIDEHRSSFRLTPVLNWIDNKKDRDVGAYDDHIEQMWFVGAHSNIGGGYPNNILSMKPLNWIMEGASDTKNTHLKKVTLHDEALKIPAEIPQKKDIRDSFAELAGKIYPHIIRAKRNFRPIGRANVVRAGYTLRTINEKIHQSVFDFAVKNELYAPPNLIAHLRRNPKNIETVPEATKEIVEKLKHRTHQHKWPGERMIYTDSKETIGDALVSRLLLIVWSLLAALGIVRMAQFFWIEPFSTNLYALAIIACTFILVDWGEHKVTLAKNFYPKAIRLEVCWNILYWIRLLGIMSFFIGFICFITLCTYGDFKFNFSLGGVVNYLGLILLKLQHWPFYIALGAVLLTIFSLEWLGGKYQIRVKDIKVKIDLKQLPDLVTTEHNQIQEQKLGAKEVLFLGIPLLISMGLVVFTLSNFCSSSANQKHIENLPGSMLLIFILCFASWHIFKWVAKPMGEEEANIGSILKLQTRLTSTQLTTLFNAWFKQFHRTWLTDEDKNELQQVSFSGKSSETNEKLDDQIKDPNCKKAVAWLNLREVLRKAIWRDTLGFVPLYSFIMGVILCIGSTVFCENLVSEQPFWLYLVLFTAFFDWLENGIELVHIHKHPLGGSNTATVILGALFTFLKFIGFFTAVLVSVIVIFLLLWNNLRYVGDNKWMFSVFFTYFIFIGIVAYLFKKIKKNFWN